MQLPEETCSCCHNSSVADFLADSIRCCCTVNTLKLAKLLLLAMLLAGNRRTETEHEDQCVSACHLHVRVEKHAAMHSVMQNILTSSATFCTSALDLHAW